jgi:hypothetical protein
MKSTEAGRTIRIPILPSLSEYAQIFTGMALQALVWAAGVELLYVLVSFLLGRTQLGAWLTVAAGAWSFVFVMYIVLDFSSKNETLLRKALLFRAAGRWALRHGRPKEALIYFEEAVRNLANRTDTRYNYLLEQMKAQLHAVQKGHERTP